MEDLQVNLEDRTREEQSEILARDIIKVIGIDNPELIHKELDKFQIRGNLSITTELFAGKTNFPCEKLSKHVEFYGYDYKVQCCVNFAYFLNQ